MNQGFQNLALTSQDFLMTQLQTEQMPNQLLNYPPILKLDCILIKNFKSFKQQTYTGPFLGFTSIIGPNGSGKSNVLDALIFGLCGENLKHNFFDVREYINRQKTQTYRQMSQKKKKCLVQVIFLLQNNKKLSLKRQLDPQKNQKFYIDHEQVTKNIYENFLLRSKLNPHIPNYAITQGQIDKLILRQPLQLTNHIQNLSGSILYKKKYQSTKQQLQIVRKNIINMTQKMNKLKNDKKTAKNINQASKQYQQIQKQYQDTINKLFLAKIFLRQLQVKDLQEQVKNKKEQQNQKIQMINQRKLKIQQEIKKKQQLNRETNLIEKKILQLKAIEKSMNRPDILIKATQLENNQKEVQFIRKQINSLQQKMKKLQQNIPQVHTTQVINQYLKIFSEWQAKNKQIKLELENKKTIYFNLQSQRQFQKSLLDEEIQKEKKVKQQNQKRKADIEGAKKQEAQTIQLIAKMKKQKAFRQQKYQKNAKQLRQLKEDEQKFNNQAQNLVELLTQNVQNQKDKQIIKRLCIVQGFQGIIQQKIRPRRDKQAVAFSILTSNISKYLLCKDEDSSKQISNKLKEMNTVKTLIILGNVKKNSDQNNSIKHAIGKSGIMAIEIIDFQKNLKNFDNFLNQYCKGKVVCQDLKTAFQLRNRKIPGLKQIITFNGQVVRNDGMITSYGNTDHLKKSLKLGSNKTSLQNELRKIEKAKDQIRQKISKLQKQCNPEQQIRYNQQINRLQRKRQQIQQKIKFLTSIKPKQSKSYKNIQKDIQSIIQKLQKVNKQIQEIQKSMSKNVQIKQFMKKHKIQNLQSFRSTSNLGYLQKQVKRKNEILKTINQIKEQIQIKKQKIDSKMIRINHLKEDLQYGSSSQDKKNIKDQIQRHQKMLKDNRQEIAKLGSFRQSDLQLKSQVIEKQTKLRHQKQKYRQYIQDLKSQMCATIPNPKSSQDYKILQDYISSGDINRLNKKKIQKSIKDLQNQQKLCQQKLQKFNSINLLSKKSDKQEEQINQQIKNISKLVQEDIKKRSQLNQSLQNLKQQRKKVFLNFFYQVKTILHKTYQLLTRTHQGQNLITGKADLFLQNSQTPFQSGIYFSATPPQKRFVYDLQQLSGGQKSIASLSLQYSLSLASKSPFLILDQSDAFLDQNNSHRLLNLVTHSFQRNKLQIIIITHKTGIYQKCQSLVGVTRPNKQFSQVFSLKVK